MLLPDRARESRPDTERLDVAERDERDERAEAPDDVAEDARDDERAEPEPEPPLPATASPVGVERSMPPGATTGARPQVSQYSSPPPMSSYEPSHEGR
ncbi:hypothetical protein [Streptomyces sp. MS191]